jgi:hypothetical protein
MSSWTSGVLVCPPSSSPEPPAGDGEYEPMDYSEPLEDALGRDTLIVGMDAGHATSNRRWDLMSGSSPNAASVT